MVKLCDDKDRRLMTIDDLLSLIEKVNKGDQRSKSLYKLVAYIKKRPTYFSKITYAGLLDDDYLYDLKKAKSEENEKMRVLQNKHFVQRRSLLHQAVKEISDLNKAFLLGFSLYSVSSSDFSSTFYTLHPEIGGQIDSIMSELKSHKIIGANEIPEYQPYFVFDNNASILRSSYYFSDSKLHMVVENITNDLGGYYRILNLLEYDKIPDRLLNTKVLCICDRNNINKFKEIYLKSNLANACMHDTNSTFEVLIITYYGQIYNGSMLYALRKEEKTYEKNQTV